MEIVISREGRTRRIGGMGAKERVFGNQLKRGESNMTKEGGYGKIGVSIRVDYTSQ